MRIFISTPKLSDRPALFDDPIPLDVEPTDAIKTIADFIHGKFGVPQDDQRFIFAGKGLSSDAMFRDYNIARDSTIHLVMKLRSSDNNHCGDSAAQQGHQSELGDVPEP